MTLLRGLEDKGSVAHENLGRTFVFFPLVEEDRFRQRATRDLLDRVFGGSAGNLMVHLLKNEPVTSADLVEIRRLIDQSERDR
jgi:BlaI family transcriptional regulator, penicillinase repressor